MVNYSLYYIIRNYRGLIEFLIFICIFFCLIWFVKDLSVLFKCILYCNIIYFKYIYVYYLKRNVFEKFLLVDWKKIFNIKVRINVNFLYY